MENRSIVYIVEQYQAYNHGCQIIDVFFSLEKAIEVAKNTLENIFSRDKGRKKYKNLTYTLSTNKFINESCETYEISVLFEDISLNYDTFFHVTEYRVL